MATVAQTEANKQNAARSTGPKTANGKARSRSNAIRHGLRSELPVLPGERLKEWEQYREGILLSLAPVGTLEEELAGRVALCLWRLRRVMAFETAAATAGIEQVDDDRRAAAEKADNHDLQVRIRAPYEQPDHIRLALAEQGLRAEQLGLSNREAGRGLVEQIVAGVDDTTAVDGYSANTLIGWANNALPGDKGVDYENDRFLTRLGVPTEDDPWGWEGWTAGMVRQAVALMATAYKMANEKLWARLVEAGHREVGENRERVQKIEEEVKVLRRRVRTIEERKRQANILPDENTLNKVLRYESHVSRQMLQALHTLERLQAARAGADFPPPAAVDVTVDGPPPALDRVLENASQP
jgi:hypothetical protein